ncbi:hypothetical protein [Pseudomonas sp. P8_241]|uniref:ankyrin repeat domain-containing protein n=1 Tax=Pseudomonas sp. P8_241 TaxID=3043445 RepID=UPI002A36823D|nr:hypothetical protein [Pseudomonas sp. P8_241]WPN49162.1 hypothetical protein QMK58_11055 [Pseudomonas sp. P8_241]
MGKFPGASQAVYEAAIRGDFHQVNASVAAGANLNALNSNGDTLLQDMVFWLAEDQSQLCGEMLRLLLQLGANPNILGDEGSSALTAAMLCMNSELLGILLSAGADPNQPRGLCESDSFYDWAEFDYSYNVWMRDNVEFELISPPEEPTDADQVSEESYLDYLDRMAVKYGVRRPDHLLLLRRFGAKSAHEINT